MTDTREWHAWLNIQPPPPDDLHVIGQVFVGNPGVVAVLTERIPQGISPTVLLLDLNLVQRPGVWPQVMTWVEARFNKVYGPGGTRPSQVEVFHKNEVVASLDVQTVS